LERLSAHRDVPFRGRPATRAAFARFKLVDGVATSIVYSHRIYGEKVGDQMSNWLNDNGPKMEKDADGVEQQSVTRFTP
jgi:hypothetical protein